MLGQTDGPYMQEWAVTITIHLENGRWPAVKLYTLLVYASGLTLITTKVPELEFPLPSLHCQVQEDKATHALFLEVLYMYDLV